MQKLERYFGFKVILTDRLAPARIDVLKEKAAKLLALRSYNPFEYHLYFHALQIVPNRSTTGGDGGLSRRCQNIRVTFSINPKLRKNGRMCFLNHLIDEKEVEMVRAAATPNSINYHIDAPYFARQLHFYNEIVTYVHRRLRNDHRKIKVGIRAMPTDQYAKILTQDRAFTETQLDFCFGKYIPLDQPPNDDQASAWQYRKGDLMEHTDDQERGHSLMDPMSILALISAGLSVISKFKALFRDRETNKVEAKQVGDKLELIQGGKVIQTIPAHNIKMDKWDNERYTALNNHMSDAWRQYNQLYSSLLKQSVDEQVRLENKMEALRHELCKDFNEMISIYERALGVPLGEHFTLRDICSGRNG